VNHPTAETLLIVDFETTGIDPYQDEPIELGAILYAVPQRTTLAQLSILLPIEAENAAERINRIPAAASRSVRDAETSAAIALFQTWLDRADYLVAHNADFDRGWLGYPPTPPSEKPWLCTYQHFQWPHNETATTLIATALNHGIGVSSAHRALTDCQLVAALFDRVEGFENLLAEAIRISFEAKYRIVANVSFEKKDLAKARGYRWDPRRREWFVEIPEGELGQFVRTETESAGFTVRVGDKIPAFNAPPLGA